MKRRVVGVDLGPPIAKAGGDLFTKSDFLWQHLGADDNGSDPTSVCNIQGNVIIKVRSVQ